jgi:hypothetical protein
VRLTVSMLLLLCSAGDPMAADDIESLDEDFLAYLAEFEGDDDDWTIVETAPAARSPAKPADEPAAKTATKVPATTSIPKPATPVDGSKR